MQGQAPRYRLLESPRVYARERLEAAGDLEPVQRAHALVVHDLLTAMHDEREAGRVPWDANREAARADTDNARDAFGWARAAGQPQLAVEIGGSLLYLLMLEAVVQRVALCDAMEAVITTDMPHALRARAWLQVALAMSGMMALVDAQLAAGVRRRAQQQRRSCCAGVRPADVRAPQAASRSRGSLRWRSPPSGFLTRVFFLSNPGLAPKPGLPSGF